MIRGPRWEKTVDKNCIFKSVLYKVRSANNELPESFHIFKICILIIIQFRYFKVGVFFIR